MNTKELQVSLKKMTEIESQINEIEECQKCVLEEAGSSIEIRNHWRFLIQFNQRPFLITLLSEKKGDLLRQLDEVKTRMKYIVNEKTKTENP